MFYKTQALTLKEISNLIFKKKSCPKCSLKLKKCHKTEYKGRGFDFSKHPRMNVGDIYETKFLYKCEKCNKIYSLKEL